VLHISIAAEQYHMQIKVLHSIVRQFFGKITSKCS